MLFSGNISTKLSLSSRPPRYIELAGYACGLPSADIAMCRAAGQKQKKRKCFRDQRRYVTRSNKMSFKYLSNGLLCNVLPTTHSSGTLTGAILVLIVETSDIVKKRNERYK